MLLFIITSNILSHHGSVPQDYMKQYFISPWVCTSRL